MGKDRYAVGVVTGAIHFLAYNSELYFEEDIDTLAKVTYKFPILPNMEVGDPLAMIVQVYMNDNWERVRPEHSQVWGATLALRTKAKSMAYESRIRRLGARLATESELKMLLPLKGE